VTPAELEAGLAALNEADPPLFSPLAVHASFRHMCTGSILARRSGKPVSEPLDLKERYVTSWVDGQPVEQEDGAEYAILFREGVCKKCKASARSPRGIVVKTAERAPLHGRVARD
jgi:hypothetical protein